MNKKILVVLWVCFIVFITVGLWGLLPLRQWLWLKYSMLALSIVNLLLGAFWWIKNHKVMLPEQQVLLAQDTHCIQQLFKQATHKIIGNRHNKLESLYSLPWYLVLGGKGDAKSALLQQNGMELLLSRHLDERDTECYLRFWINDASVVIEVGHSIFDNEGIDEDLWQVLSKQLLKYRPRQALNGVIAVISSERMIKNDSKERYAMAGIYQEAILALNSELRLGLPLYVTFSKADTLADFTEFFESFSDVEIASPFGLTFPNDASPRFDKDNFDKQKNQLLKSLADTQFELLHNSRDGQAASVIRLPYQLNIFFERVGLFFTELGRENRVRKSVWIRGAYLFSTGQKGSQYDLLTQVVAEQNEFNLNRANEQLAGKRSYFTSRLFSYVFFPEKESAGLNKWRNTSYLVWCGIVLFIALTFISIAGIILKNNWSQEENWRTNAILELRDSSSNVQSLKQSDSLTDMIAVLTELRTIATQGIVPKKWHQRVSIMQEDTTQHIYNNYLEQLNRILLPKLVTLIGNELKKYNSMSETNNTFDALRYYQMLFDKQKLDLPGMQEYIQSIISNQKIASLDDLNDLTLLVADLFSSDYDKRIKPDTKLIAAANLSLDGLSVDRLIYERIKTLPEYNYQTDIRSQLGDNFNTLFEFSVDFHGYLMPGIYTKQGYKQLDLTAKSTLLRQQLKDFKVLRGDMSGVTITEVTALSQRIQKLYFADYIYYWKNLTDNIHVRSFSNSNELALMLKNARDPVRSPVLGVIGTVVANTTLAIPDYPDTRDSKNIASQLGVAKIAKDLRTADTINRAVGENILSAQPSNVVNDEFLPFSSYLNGSGVQSENAPLMGLLQKFDNLNSYLDAALLNGDPGKAFASYAQDHAKGSEDAIVLFQRSGGQAPNQVAIWINNISKQIWQQVLGGSVSYLNNQWNERVYQFYQTAIAGRFPFGFEGRGEVALSDFTQFFKPQGRIDQFIEQSLSTFVYWDNGELKRSEIDGFTLPISQGILDQLSNAHRLTQVFFGQSNQVLTLKVMLKAESMSNSLTEFRLTETEPVFSYRQGPRFWNELTWPNDNIDASLIAAFYLADNRIAVRKYAGQWALFRFIFDGKSINTAEPLIRNLDYQINNNHIVLLYTLQGAPFALDKKLFESFVLPETL